MPISGFPEWMPPQRMIEQRVIDRIRSTFELYGFSPLETRSVEPPETLVSKGETSQAAYLLRRLEAGDRAVPFRALPDRDGGGGSAPAGGRPPPPPAAVLRGAPPGQPAVPLRHRD